MRAQALGFKITVVGAAAGAIIGNLDKVSAHLLVVPALAAIFFDFVITSYSFSIKRIGHYIRTELEPVFRTGFQLPERFQMWEEFIGLPSSRQRFSMIGNVGLTGLATFAAGVGLFAPYRPVLTPVLLTLLVGLVIADILTHLRPGAFMNKGEQ